MTAFEWTISITLASLAAATGVYWTVLITQVLATVRSVPNADQGLRSPIPPRGPVCVVIPAHNEEEVIADLIRSLKAQTLDDFRVVLAFDRCTDQTEPIALQEIDGDPRFRIVRVGPGPEGWAGKVNAVWQGVLRATEAHRASYLLFSDADCVFHPRGIEATVSLLERERLDMLSLVNRLTHDTWFERLVQPGAGFELLTQYPLRRANRERNRRGFANGQFMLFRASAYRRLGGHTAVTGELLEDLAFARVMAEREMRQWAVMSGAMVTCRMYRSWDAFCKGWKRIFIEGARRKPARLMKNAWQLRCTSTLLPTASIGAGLLSVGYAIAGSLPAAGWLLPICAAWGVGAWAGGVSLIYGLGGYPLWMAFGHPIGAWMVADLLRESGRDRLDGRPVRWAGHSYARAVR